MQTKIRNQEWGKHFFTPLLLLGYVHNTLKRFPLSHYTAGEQHTDTAGHYVLVLIIYSTCQVKEAKKIGLINDSKGKSEEIINEKEKMNEDLFLTSNQNQICNFAHIIKANPSSALV
ncbi:hypothetical protein AMECASPLE_011182 [Ameca splendens]|uniref:Uncharacterized protein n=1 Tax=Ameca splendens TaxID=208324 RepID=A0ABV0YYK9_9TELE